MHTTKKIEKTELCRIHFESVDSTNNYAKTQVDQWRTDRIYLITADEQTAGRGQFRREWQSPNCGNLYATFGFFLGKIPDDVGGMTLDLARAAQSCMAEYGVQAKIKWPNDLVIGEKKVAGILGELVEGPKGYFLIMGIGINVNMPLEDCLAVTPAATSLLVERQVPVSSEAFLERLCLAYLAVLETPL